jgi:hypothetical protein
MDEITLSRTVMFVGDYFTLMTTVVLDNNLRNEDESEHDFSIRVASVFVKEYYGFDVASVSNSIGVVDEAGEELDDNDNDE